MPAKSKAQQEFMAIELAKKRKGEKAKTSMSESELKKFAATKRKGLPAHVPQKKKRKMKTDTGFMYA